MKISMNELKDIIQECFSELKGKTVEEATKKEAINTKEVKDFIKAMLILNDKWDSLGLNDLDGYPLKESFDDVTHSLLEFFHQKM